MTELLPASRPLRATQFMVRVTSVQLASSVGAAMMVGTALIYAPVDSLKGESTPYPKKLAALTLTCTKSPPVE